MRSELLRLGMWLTYSAVTAVVLSRPPQTEATRPLCDCCWTREPTSNANGGTALQAASKGSYTSTKCGEETEPLKPRNC